MSVAQLRGVAPYSDSTWRKELAEAKKEMGVGTRLLDPVSQTGNRNDSNVLKLQRGAETIRYSAQGAPISFGALMSFSEEV